MSVTKDGIFSLRIPSEISKTKRKALMLSFLFLAFGTHLVSAQEAAPTIANGVFTEEQAKRGETLYQSKCGSCHGSTLIARYPDAPSLTAPGFAVGWHGKTLAERFDRIRATMPLGNPESLDDQEYLDIVTYILQFNGYPAGPEELKPDMEMLQSIVITPPPEAN